MLNEKWQDLYDYISSKIFLINMIDSWRDKDRFQLEAYEDVYEFMKKLDNEMEREMSKEHEEL